MLDSFQVYTGKHQGRKLTQLSDRGEGEVNFLLFIKISNDKVLLVNSLQMTVLVLFNQQNAMTAKKIENEAKILFSLVQNVLKPLVTGKVK